MPTYFINHGGGPWPWMPDWRAARGRPSGCRRWNTGKWPPTPASRTSTKTTFVPLFVALGAAEDAAARRVYHDTGLFGGVTASSYRFG